MMPDNITTWACHRWIVNFINTVIALFLDEKNEMYVMYTLPLTIVLYVLLMHRFNKNSLLVFSGTNLR
jgi:hypothetical protein